MVTMMMKTKLKWVVLIGLVFSFASVVTRIPMAKYSTDLVKYSYTHTTIIRWRPDFDALESTYLHNNKTFKYRWLWGPEKSLAYLKPLASPRGKFPAASWQNNGFVFVKIHGGFHEIRSSICDAVVVARLLNATLVIPELQEATTNKWISSKFKSFGYLYDENQFISALASDVVIVRSLPKRFKSSRKNNDLPLFTPPRSASVDFYLNEVLPKLKKKRAIGLLISGGGCLQALLPSKLSEYQRLRCRVNFHALTFRREIFELGTRLVHRLRSFGRPFLAFHPGLERDTLAYFGCAELFQDVHTELIQYRRAWMIKHGIIQGNLTVESELQRRNGSCPLMPEEVAVLLRAMGYPADTVVYISGGEVFGGQRVLIPFRAQFTNLVDRESLCTEEEMSSIYGPEESLFTPPPPPPPADNEKLRLERWQKAGPRPRPLPPPASRPKFPHEIEGWWGWIAETDKEPEPSPLDLRVQAHKLLWEALDYMVCLEADAFFPGFDRDGNGLPGFASLVMGHRLYTSSSLKTYHSDRKGAVKLIDSIHDHLYKPNRTWLVSVRQHLMKSTQESGLTNMSIKAKPDLFLAHPFPECGCQLLKTSHPSSPKSNVLTDSLGHVLYGGEVTCPEWMSSKLLTEREKEEDEVSEDGDANPGQILDTGLDIELEDSNGKSELSQQNDEEDMDVDD